MNESIIAKKYAIAFLNTYEEKLTIDCFKTFKIFSKFLKANPLFIAALSVPSIPIERKHDFLIKTLDNLHVHKYLQKLVFLLLKENRIELLGKVLKNVSIQYKKRNGIIKFYVSSSHELDEKEKIAIKSFVKKNMGEHSKTSFLIDKNLISGLRMKSSIFLWERSIDKRLRTMKQSLLRQDNV
mgnify:CR=1 FL=1|jgi:ATP synthase F1 delta subunit